MSMALDLRNAKIEDLCSHSFDDIYNFITKIESHDELYDILKRLATAVGSTENTISELASKILSSCMSNIELEKFGDIILLCLSDSDQRVRMLALEELKNPERHLNMDRSVICSVISCLESDDTSVGTAAIEILSKVLIYDTDNMYFDVLKRRLDYSSTIRCRVYEILVNLSKNSPEMMKKWNDLLEQMLSELDFDDILLQMTIFELLISLSEQNHGFSYLESKQIFERVSSHLEAAEQSPMSSILYSQFLRFFSRIAANHPRKIITEYPNVIRAILNCFTSSDLEDLRTGLQTLGDFTNTTEGKILLQQYYAAEMKIALGNISNSIGNLPSDLKVLAFICLCAIFKTEGQRTPEICTITKQWYEYLTKTTDFSFLLRFFRMPFSDIKHPTLLLLKILCEYDWGVIALQQTAGLVEYLLDRRAEPDKDILHVKFEIISLLSESNHFDAGTLSQLKKYVSDGIFYVEGIAEVAFEGS